MITIRDKNKFWEFLYGIEGLDIPDENGAHHTIAGRIEGIFLFIDKEWKLEELKIKEPFTENFIKLNKYEGTISEHIKSGQPTIRTLNSFIAYFFLNLSRIKNKQEKIDLLIKLEQFFYILDASQLIEKYFVYTEKLINHLLETIDLDYIHCKLDSSFNLSFINTDIENKIDEYTEGIIGLDNRSSKTFSKLDNYRNELREEFKEIRVGFTSFSISIEQVIELPFYSIDDEKKNKIVLFERELKLSEGNNDLEKVKRLREKIEKLKEFLNEPNNPSEVLRSEADIFILSPAGSGKTTTLKSFAYSLASEQNKLPIFIELQSYKSDLKNLISEELEPYGLDLISLKDYSLVLLIDGFDEYSRGDESTLLKEIKNFKRKTNCQIIFAGRFKPKKINEKDFNTFKLSEFSHKDINRMFKLVFPNKGQKYFDDLKKEDLLRFIETPLFLFLLIINLKNYDDDEIDLNYIRELLENRAKLLETVLISDFIYKYEIERQANNHEHQWESTKHLQVQIISLFAYYLTFELDNTESAHFKDDKVIEYLDTHNKSSLFDYIRLFNDFKKHSILTLKRDYVGFDKKEIRLFFAANHLITQINNIDDYLKFKAKFKGDNDSWNSIEKYVFGLIKPNKFMVDLKTFVVKDQIIYSNSFIQQLEYALQFIYNGNFVQNFDLLNKFYFLNIIVMILFNHLKYGMNYTEGFSRSKYEPYFLFRRLKIPYSRYFHFLIPRSNYYYHCYYPSKNVTIFHYLHNLKEILELPQSKIVFKEIKVNTSNFKILNYSLNSPAITFTKIENSPNLIFSFVDCLIFDPNFRIKKDSKVDTNDLKNLENFLKHFFRLNAHSYLDYYLTSHNPTPLNIKTLYVYYKKNHIRIDSKKNLPKTKEIIINHFNLLARHNQNKNTNKFVQLVNDAILYILDSDIKNELLASWRIDIISSETDLKTKQRLFYIYAEHPFEYDIPLFSSFLESKNEEFKLNAIWGLTKYLYSRSKNDESIRLFNEKLHDFFNESNINFKLQMIQIFENFPIRLSKDFESDIVKFAHQEKESEYTFIKFFGSFGIKEAIPYLINILNRKELFFEDAYESLLKINNENHFKHIITFLEYRRKNINSYLRNTKNEINLLPISDSDIDDLKKDLKIED
ncbi:NACHT domain-containing protein [Flavobacterium sp.]|uniref:NACHT domain-containing protein n=1 Tax=Flavobacterium sp. TaxID=239 RepID=UPI003F69A344